MKRFTRKQGLHFEAFGSILIATVMLTDRFLFGIQDGFILACAIVSAITLIIGIRTVKYWDEQAQETETQKTTERLVKRPNRLGKR